jgi:hypothetical protein
MNNHDRNNVVTAHSNAVELSNTLKELIKSEDVLLSEIVLDLHDIVVKIEKKLRRISSYNS